jgi:hypothetical protein
VLELTLSLSLLLPCSPHVSFVGYSMPHPTEEVVNIRVQTTGKHRAVLWVSPTIWMARLVACSATCQPWYLCLTAGLLQET